MPSFLRNAACVALMLGLPLVASAADSIYVQVRTSKLRSQPNAWSSQVSSLSYGDSLTPIEESGSWIKAKTSKGQLGYVPASSVTNRKVVLAGNNQVVTSNAGNPDVVLAGKGFTKEVEDSFKTTSNLDFRGVDAMEKVRIAEGDAKAFAKSGQLKG